MDPIHVPGPPKEAFNKNRRVSDLIRAQVNHFKHVEQKLSASQRKAIPQHEISAEGEAALYIAAMTALLRGQPVAVPSPGQQAASGIRLVGSRSVAGPTPVEGIAIAASAEAESAPPDASPASGSKKKDSAPKETK